MEEDRERVSPPSPPSRASLSLDGLFTFRLVFWPQQKRLRERIWILPIPHLLPSSNRQLSSAARHSLGSSSTDPSPESPFTPASPFTPKTPRDVVLGGKAEKADRDKGTETGVVESALDIEFEQVWETTSELNDDDLREMDVSSRARSFSWVSDWS